MSRRLLPALLAALAVVATAAPSAGAQQASPRIIGGSGATITQYPYQVRVLITSGLVMESQCGGWIRDATHIVTAAHCVTDDLIVSRTETAPADVSVRYGTANTATHSVAAVSDVTVAPRYLAMDDNHDAALLTLSQPLAGYGGPAVRRIPFAGAGELAAAVEAGHHAVATGYGATSEGGQVSPQMLAVSLPLRADSVCSGYYGAVAYSPPLAVCAGGTGTAGQNNPDTCQGDSGGPLAIPVGGVLKAVGITSRGDGCGKPGVPAVYTEASNPEICAVLGGGAECLTAPPPPPPAPARRDTTRPTARLSYLRCKKRRCTFRVRTADDSGRVRALSARVVRNVRRCRTVRGKRRCRTVKKIRKLRTRRIRGGYKATAKLYVATYRFEAVATDTARNRSKIVRKRFKVRKR